MRDARCRPARRGAEGSDPDVREQAAFALGQLRDKRARARRCGRAQGSERRRAGAGGVRARSAARRRRRSTALIAALRDAKPDVREQAAFALGQIRDRRAVEPLISALKDANADVRQQAAFALGQMRDRAAVEALVIALKDTDADVREQVAFALGQIRDPRAIDGADRRAEGSERRRSPAGRVRARPDRSVTTPSATGLRRRAVARPRTCVRSAGFLAEERAGVHEPTRRLLSHVEQVQRDLLRHRALVIFNPSLEWRVSLARTADRHARRRHRAEEADRAGDRRR